MIDYFADGTLAAADQGSVAPAGRAADDAAIARLASGGFVVTYMVDRAVMVQRYDDQGGKVGAAAALTTGGSTTSNSQPSVIGLTDGRYVVSWVDSSSHVAVQIFDANGTATAPPFGVGVASNYQQQPALAALANGDFAVAWTFNGSASSIRAQVFHADGQAATGEIVATASPYFNSYFPQIAGLAGGGFVLSWSGGFDQTGGATVRTQAYDAAGTPQGSAVRVPNVVSYHDNSYQSVAALPGGGYVLTWTEAGDSNGVTSKVMGQLYNADGSTAGDRFQVSTSTGYDAGQAMVTAIDGGGFLVSWYRAVPGSGPNYFQIGDVQGQFFDAAGHKVGGEFLVNLNTRNGQILPIVTGFGTGDAAVVWQSYDDFGRVTLASRIFHSVTNGTADADVMAGTAGADALRGHDGNDWLTGGAGNDLLDGGAGIDTADYAGAPGGVTVDLSVTAPQDTGGAGVDTLQGIENLVGSAFDDVLGGDAGANRLTGGTGQDWLSGVGGDDFVIGGDGHDSLWGGDGADELDGGAGDDTIVGGAGIDTVTYANAAAGVEVDLAWLEDQNTRGAGTDTLVSIEYLIGSNFGDRLAGDAGSNWLNGGAGNDVLIGRGGDDLLTGGAGADLFGFGLDSGNDRISDFAAGTDRIDLSAYGFANFAQLQAAMTEQAGNTTIALGGGNAVTLTGVTIAELGTADFVLNGDPFAFG